MKETKDKQEDDLKQFKMPWDLEFGLDSPEQYGTLTTLNDAGELQERKVESVPGDYGRVYDDLFDAIRNGTPLKIKHEETLKQMEMLETGIKDLF